jgi:hypothetical protein
MSQMKRLTRYRENGVDVIDKKVEVLKNDQHHACTNDASDEPDFFSSSFISGNIDTREIINDDSNEKNKDVLRYEEHIKEATGSKQEYPPVSMWQQKIQEEY